LPRPGRLAPDPGPRAEAARPLAGSAARAAESSRRRARAEVRVQVLRGGRLGRCFGSGVSRTWERSPRGGGRTRLT
jgi:hypothetical protein